MANLFLGRFRFAQREPRTVADVKNMILIRVHGEKYSVFMLAMAVKNFTDFSVKRFTLWRERTAFWKTI
ncbi:MAG: hypothetical protein ABI042_03890, partial [Verrucomicrobiota bacterium]